MLQLILTLQLMQIHPTTTAQVQPCVWPNRCERPVLAQVQPCVWPNRCAAPRLFSNG